MRPRTQNPLPPEPTGCAKTGNAREFLIPDLTSDAWGSGVGGVGQGDVGVPSGMMIRFNDKNSKSTSAERRRKSPHRGNPTRQPQGDLICAFLARAFGQPPPPIARGRKIQLGVKTRNLHRAPPFDLRAPRLQGAETTNFHGFTP